ncbi:NitT/TauT family transport system substrate-binding protein [Ruminococcus sp. YE71]|uniref:ABC transporter substrate-binding protein n=1 Tax=unclassified Ruminococcus TaxID=2608920 RepID=UPI0008925431|nr:MULTISPECIES: ABC transporter substrate-binding protein [unclassified Ruminococcus]SDA22705.1 NitT/TauT family transport system substrate-binding protein [Ruminococcus sp. YE78]SFW38638.1 NitT/TauT family transport system substrate-binding protein [Ruminococcus sp. YE71]
MKRKNRIIGAFTALVCAVSIMASCSASTADENSSGGAAKDSPKGTSASNGDFKYGHIQIPGKDGSLCSAPIYIAYEKGFFAEQGFDVELISADFETRKIGLNNGTIPIVNGDFQFFPSIENGIDVKVVDGLHEGCIKFAVRPDSDIYTVNDLKGKKIAVDEIGGTPHQTASLWLENAGISADPADGEVTFLPYSDGNLEFEALQNGEVDVAAVWDPLGSVKEKAGEVRIIFDLSTDDFFKDHFCCFLYASNKLIKEDPQQIADLLKAYRKAQEWIYENPEEAVDIITEKKHSAIEDKELAVQLIKSYGYPSASEHGSEWDAKVQENVQYFVNGLSQIGYLQSDPKDFAKELYYKVDVS